MSTANPIDLLFSGMEKLGPGSDDETRQMLRRLPSKGFDVTIDAGCGTGRQTMVLIDELGTAVHAIDTHEPFLRVVRQRAAQANVSHLVRTHCMDIKDIADTFGEIDLLWCEGAAYNIGFANALSSWSRAILSGGYAAVSELSWLSKDVPEVAEAFFALAYPQMQLTTENVRIAERAGYDVIDTCTLSRKAWTDGYYDVLGPRAAALANHADPLVRQFAQDTLKEIDVFESAEGSYGYVFYLLRRR